MVNASPDVAASTPAPAPRTQARNERSSHTDNFAALVDSNTAAYDKASSAPKPDTRSSSSASDDRGSSRSSRTDRSDATDRSRSRDTSDDSRRADNAASSDAAKSDTKTTDTAGGDKTGTTKSDKADNTKSAKDDKSGVAKDTDAKGADQTDSKDASATPPVTITPNAAALIAAQVTTTATAPNAEGDAAGSANGTPLAIAAAAALKAKADAGTTTTQTAPADQTGTAEATQTGVAADPKLAALAAQANGAKADTKAGTKTDATAKAGAKTDGTAKSDAKGEATTTMTTAQAAAAQAATANATTGTPVPPQPGQTTPDGQPAGDAKLAHALAGAGDDASPKAGASHLKPDAALPQAQAQADANTMLPQTPIAVPQHLQPAATNGVNAAAASQLTATNAANAPVPVEGLAVEIATRAKGGATRFDIRLDPAELGRIDVRIDVDRHGQVTSHLTVEKPETLQMLRQDQTQLQRALDDAGLKTGDGGLQFSLRDQSSSGQQGQQQESGRRSQRLVISQDELPPTPVASRGYGRMLGASGGVDIRI